MAHSPLASRRRAAFGETHQHGYLAWDGVDLDAAAAQFRSLGGVLQTVSTSSGAGTKFRLRANDHLYPVDRHGVTCSQVMYCMLRRVTRRVEGFNGVVQLPHATEKLEPVDPHLEVQLVPTAALDRDGFREAFGVKRQELFGEQEFSAFLGDAYRTANDELFDMTRDFFDQRYYAPPTAPGVRRVYFCFAESAHVVLQRLVDAAQLLEAETKVDVVSAERGARGPIRDRGAGATVVTAAKLNGGLHRSPLQNVVVVAIPYGDDCIASPPSGVEPFSAVAYKKAYEKYELTMDVPNSRGLLEEKSFF